VSAVAEAAALEAAIRAAGKPERAVSERAYLARIHRASGVTVREAVKPLPTTQRERSWPGLAVRLALMNGPAI
jgi:hypothetical protein